MCRWLTRACTGRLVSYAQLTSLVPSPKTQWYTSKVFSCLLIFKSTKYQMSWAGLPWQLCLLQAMNWLGLVPGCALRSAPHVRSRGQAWGAATQRELSIETLVHQRQTPLCQHRSILCSHTSTNIPLCSKSWQLHYLNFETTFSQTMLLMMVLYYSVSLTQDTQDTRLAFTAREDSVSCWRTSLLFHFQ